VETLATSRVRVAGPDRGRKGVVRSEEGEKSIAWSFIWRTLYLCCNSCSDSVFAGKARRLGEGVSTVTGRRGEVLDLERVWVMAPYSIKLFLSLRI
jgi:hypothetical protein